MDGAFEPLPRSHVPDIVWPAIPSDDGGRLLALLYQLGETERQPADHLRRQQLRQAGLLLRHAIATVPAYRERLAAAGFDPDGEELTEDVWAAIPLLTRAELQRLGPALDSTAPPADHGKVYEAATSGSTGRPVVVKKTDHVSLLWHAATVRHHIWHRRDLASKLASIRHFRDPAEARPPDGIRAAQWGPSTAMAYDTGPCVILALRSTIDDQVDWLLREQPDYLLTHPSNMLDIARALDDAGRRIDGLKGAMTISETLTPAARQEIRERLGVPLSDSYSAQEIGYMALQCPESDGYHVQAETVMVEVLDDAGKPCAPGTVGRVVLTPLHNFATPLIRYDIGDYAEVGESCPCGRTLPVLTRIMGRTRNLLTLPDGSRRWPVVGSYLFTEIAPVRQFQLVQHSVREIEVRLAVSRPVTDEEEAALTAVVLEKLAHPFDIRFTYHDDIPRSASGKYEDFMSLIYAGA